MIYPHQSSWGSPAVCVTDTFTLAHAEYALLFFPRASISTADPQNMRAQMPVFLGSGLSNTLHPCPRYGINAA